MSKVYRCKVKRDIRETNRVAEEIEYKVSLLDILDKEDMDQEYRQALKDLGAKEKDNGELELDVDGVSVTIDPKERTAKANVSEEKEINISLDKEENVYDGGYDRKRAQKNLEHRVDKELKQEVEEKKHEHKRKVQLKLEETQDEVKEKLREAANEAHKSALRKKAGRMGKIINDQEEDLPKGDRRLTIEIDMG